MNRDDFENYGPIRDIISDSNIVMLRNYQEKVREHLHEMNLTNIEKSVLSLRCGLDRGLPHTCEEIGDMYNIDLGEIERIEEALRFQLEDIEYAYMVEKNKELIQDFEDIFKSMDKVVEETARHLAFIEDYN